MAPCLVSDEGLFDLKDFYSKIEKYINEVVCIEITYCRLHLYCHVTKERDLSVLYPIAIACDNV